MNRWFRAKWFSLLGRQQLHSHRPDLALENFRKSGELEPHNLRTASEIAWCLYKLKDYQSAIDAYQYVIQQSPNYASARACLALGLAAMQRHHEAIDEIRRAIRMNPKIKDRGFWDHNLGTWLVHLDRWEEAIGPLCHAIELKPNEAATHYWLGIAYANLKRHAEAVREFQEALKLQPNEPDSLYSLGVSPAN